MAVTAPLPPAPDRTAQCLLAYELWTSIWTGVTLACLREHDQDLIAELEFRSLHRHHRKHFLSGMEKLALGPELPDAVRCGRYHYFSNTLGGLPMEYVEETPNKVWVRYRPPFWIGDGVTQPSAGPAALGSAFGRAAFRGWHGHNGGTLGNPRLAFVQTQNLTDGDPWDAGYFWEGERDLQPGESYQRRPGEWGPAFDPQNAPRLPHADWPEERRMRALRNYAVDHTATRFTVLSELVGIISAARIVEHAVCMVLAQRWESLPASVGVAHVETPLEAAAFFAGLAALLDDELEIEIRAEDAVVRQHTMRMWRDEPVPLPQIDHAFARAWNAALPLQAWGLRCRLAQTPSDGAPFAEWIFSRGDQP